jgi:hypothetical protein
LSIGYQAATHGRADTISRIIGTNIPTDISAGPQQDKEYQFDGGFPSETGFPFKISNLYDYLISKWKLQK